MNFLVKTVSTFFGVGFFPKAPGSLATALGVLLAIQLSTQPVVYLGVTLAVTLLGFFLTGKMEALMKEKDPGCVVIDEVSGIMIAFFMLPVNWPVIWCTFFLFRAFDMFKIYPANKFEAQGGGSGIMLDDIVAGVYTNLTMQAAVRLASWSFT